MEDSKVKANTRNLSEGVPTKQILSFFFPLMLGMLFQQVYAVVDTMIIGQFVGVNAVAGVGSTGAIYTLIIGSCIGMAYGLVIPIAQHFGMRDYPGMKQYVINAILLTIVLSIIITIIICVLCQSFLIWSNTPSVLMKDAFSYIFVIFLGTPVIFMYNVLLGIIRSMGDSRTPVIYMILGSVFNIILGLLFVVLFKWGVIGSALATIIAQGSASLLCVNYLRHCDILIISKDEWRFDKSRVKVLLGMAIPVGLQYAITSIGSVVLQIALNGLGATAVASVAIAAKINQFCASPFDALGTTMATYGGQNLGAGKLDRVHRGFISCSLIGIGYALFAVVALYFFGEKLASLFVQPGEEQVVQMAFQWLMYNSICYIPLSFVNIIRFLIQGLGYSKQSMFAGVAEMIARTVIALVVVGKIGYTAICISNGVAWLLADCFLFTAYFVDLNQLKKKFSLVNSK